MKKHNVVPAEFSEQLAVMKKSNVERSRFFSHIDRMIVQVRNSAICGSWIDVEGGNTLHISVMDQGFSMLLCDNSHCYKKVICDLNIAIVGRRLVIQNEAGGPGGDITLGADGLLRCGGVGLFRREEDILRQEMLDEMEFALRGCEDCE